MDDTIQEEDIMKRGLITLEKTKLNHTSSEGCFKDNVTAIGRNPEEHDVMNIKGGKPFQRGNNQHC